MAPTYILTSPLPDLEVGALFRWNEELARFEHRTFSGALFSYSEKVVKQAFHFSLLFPTMYRMGVDVLPHLAPGSEPPCLPFFIQVPGSWPEAAHRTLQLAVHRGLTDLATQWGQPTEEEIKFSNPQ